MDCKGDDFDKFESFVKSTLSGTSTHFIKSKHKVINDDADDEIVVLDTNCDNLFNQSNANSEGIMIFMLDHVTDSSSSSSHVSNPGSSNASTNSNGPLNKRPIASPPDLAEIVALDLSLGNPSRSSASPLSVHINENMINNATSSKRIKLASELNNVDNKIPFDEEIIIIDEESGNNDSGSDVMVVGAKIPSVRHPFGSLPVERFLSDYFPQWHNPKDDLVVGPSLVHPHLKQSLQFQKLSKRIPKYVASPPVPDDDCVPLTPSETQECLWREKFLDTLEYLLKCPICYRTVHRIGKDTMEYEQKSQIQTSRLMYSTKCGHIFCNKCIDYVRKKKQCAICRKPIRDKNQYHPLYP